MLRPDDYVITTYRDHGQALARGMTPRALMAELFGRQDGCARGKGGSMHMFDTQHELPRRPRHRRRPRAARGRRRLRHQVPRRRSGHRLLHGRVGGEHRRLPRGAEHGGALEAALCVHHREQPVRHGHGARARVGHPRHLRARRRVQHAPRPVRRAGRLRRPRRRSARPSSARGRSRSRRCSRSAPTASWATRCPTR